MTDNQNDVFNPTYFKDEVYKKWHRSGFMSVKYWPTAEKILIEIASINTESKTIVSLSMAYVNLFEFISYLKAEAEDLLDHIYPKFDSKAFKVYGGNIKDGKVESRVFTSKYWGKAPDFDTSARMFGCETFEGEKTSQGGFTPIRDKMISQNMIKMEMKDISELYESLRMSAYAYFIQKADKIELYPTES